MKDFTVKLSEDIEIRKVQSRRVQEEALKVGIKWASGRDCVSYEGREHFSISQYHYEDEPSMAISYEGSPITPEGAIEMLREYGKKKEEVYELTLEHIAELKGCDVSQIKIVK